MAVASCWPAGSSTIVSTAEARVYYPAHSYSPVACSYRFHRRVKLDLPDAEDANAPYVVNRRYVVYGTNNCDGSGCLYGMEERDLRTGRVRFDLLNGPEAACDIGGDCGVAVAKHVLLRRDGSAAWITCPGNVEEPPYESECNGRRHVQIADGHGSRIVDGGHIPESTLRFNKTHRQVLWTNAGKRRHARIYFSAAGQTIR